MPIPVLIPVLIIIASFASGLVVGENTAKSTTVITQQDK